VAASVGEIACLKTKCAPHSITVPLIKRSVASIGHEQFVLLDETIFTSSPEGVRSTTQFLLDHQTALASLRSAKPPKTPCIRC
jgi:hypothetical protein